MRKSRKARLPQGWQEIFLDAFRACANLSQSARAAGVARSTIYARKQADQQFAIAFADAEEEALENLEYEAWRRAMKGTDRPVFYKGDECGTIREYSDTLLIVLLKARAPETYRDSARVEHSGPGGGPIPIREAIVRRPGPDEDGPD